MSAGRFGELGSLDQSFIVRTLPLSGKPSFLNESRGLMAACPLEGLVRRCLTAENVSIGYDSYHLNVG